MLLIFNTIENSMAKLTYSESWSVAYRRFSVVCFSCVIQVWILTVDSMNWSGGVVRWGMLVCEGKAIPWVSSEEGVDLR